jgi:hypothetical protein
MKSDKLAQFAGEKHPNLESYRKNRTPANRRLVYEADVIRRSTPRRLSANA